MKKIQETHEKGVIELTDDILQGKWDKDDAFVFTIGGKTDWWCSTENLIGLQKMFMNNTNVVLQKHTRRALMCAMGYRPTMSVMEKAERIVFVMRFRKEGVNENTELLYCGTCKKKTKLYTCSRCNYIKFCGKECAEAGHKEHKSFCRAIAKERAAAPPTYEAPPEYVAPPPEAPPPSYTKKQKKTKPPTYPRAAALSNPPR